MTNENYLELAKICKAIYAGPVNQHLLSYNNLKMDEQRIVHGSIERGFSRIFWNSETVVFAFRGTRELVDWSISNLRMLPRSLKNCGEYSKGIRVHSGFQKTLYYMDKTQKMPGMNSILKHIQELNLFDGKRKVIITGHSLGGGLGTLLAVKLRHTFPDYIKNNLLNVVVFGSPSVGLKKFQAFYGDLNERTIRIVNGSDAVPFTPPLFYHHIGNEIWFDTSDLKLNQKWKFRFLKSLKLPISKFLKDHEMKSYIKRLKEEINNAKKVN